MQPNGMKRSSGKVLLSAYIVGVVLAAGTQLAVMIQHGPKVYVSPLWAALYPIRLFIADIITRGAYTLHLPLRSSATVAIGLAGSSALFGIVVAAAAGLTQSANRLARYVGFGGLGILVIFAVLWGTLPPAI